MSWFKAKGNSKNVKVECPNCGFIQDVSENISAVFCKKCQNTIFTKKSIKQNSETSSKEEIQEEENDSNIIETEEIENNNKEVVPPKTNMTDTPSQPSTTTSSTTSFKTKSPSYPTSSMSTSMKRITCSNCHTNQEVPSIALASFCEKCGQRINLQDYKIKGHFHGELETRGEIRIASGASVQANLNVGSAVIEGKINGEIIAEHKVILNDGCLVIGTITSPVLIVNDGAGFVGKAIINQPKS